MEAPVDPHARQGLGVQLEQPIAILGAAHQHIRHHRRGGCGIEEGARTGLANLVTGALFLAAMFVAPLASIVPSEVAAAALVIVGAMMFSHLRHVDISEFSVALPVVLTVAVMPMSYSIANGIGAGFISWVTVRSAAGKGREISPLLWIVAAGFLLYFARGGISSFVGV